MTNAIQIKVLLAILAVLVVTGALLRRGGDSIPLTAADRQLQRKLSEKARPSDRHYLVP